MEKFLYWSLFVIGIVLAGWLPAKAAYPELARHVTHILLRAPT